ncbi:MAG TPA: hypothetical protein VFV19_04890 [Candidatus Polarisedimenticolaceae bacterium]|nr:hypothetical protein [Candidatus Polarisedimenticolaceae bacterium]
MTAFEKWTLWASSIVVGITGIVYGVLKYFMRSDDPYAVTHHPLEPWVLKAHVLAAPVLVFAVGAVYTRHIVRNWRTGRVLGRRSGIATIVVVLPMIASGYLIQTVTAASWLFWIAMLHIAAGLVYLATFAGHQRSTVRAPERRSATSDFPADPDA